MARVHDGLAGLTTCLICDATNSARSLQCKECAAPLTLLEDAAAQKREPRIVSILGDSNAGKTVYLGFLLDMLSQRACEFEAVPKAAHSVDLPQRVVSHMAHRLFPPKTPIESNEWSWAYYQVRKSKGRSKWVDLVMPDLAGEAIAAEITAPSTFRVVRNLVGMSAGIVLIVDAAAAAHGATQPDFFALKMLSYIDCMNGGGKTGLIDLPIAVVLSKADHCPACFDDPAHFAQANLKRLWNLCESRCSNVRFFACSVVGALAYATSEHEEHVRPVPLHTTLRGILEPFEWVVEQL